MPIKDKDIKLLWGRSGNRCAICRIELSFSGLHSATTFPLGEQAHIVAREEAGPRGKSILTSAERDSYPNLILLCPSHHAQIDASEKDYPVEKLHIIKSEHELWVKSNLSGDDKVAEDEKPVKLSVAKLASLIFSAITGMAVGFITAPFTFFAVGGLFLPFALCIIFGIVAVLFEIATFGNAAGLGFWIGLISWFCGSSAYCAIVSVKTEDNYSKSAARDGFVGLMIGSIVGSVIMILIAQAKADSPDVLAAIAKGCIIGSIAGLLATLYTD